MAIWKGGMAYQVLLLDVELYLLAGERSHPVRRKQNVSISYCALEVQKRSGRKAHLICILAGFVGAGLVRRIVEDRCLGY